LKPPFLLNWAQINSFGYLISLERGEAIGLNQEEKLGNDKCMILLEGVPSFKMNEIEIYLIT
jgi:hypothetical protein